jgi:hypothetical protein
MNEPKPPKPPTPKPPAMKRAIVTPEGGEPVEVEIPADHPAPQGVAIVAYRFKKDAWGDDRRMTVTFPDEAK